MHPRSPAAVLLAIRDNDVTDWESLCHAVEVDPEGASVHSHLLNCLRQLSSAGLIDMSDERRPSMIRMTSAWDKIHGVLGLSLSNLVNSEGDKSMTVSPLFGRPEPLHATDAAELFVLMPFADSLRPVYEDHIKNVVRELGVTVARADDFFTTRSVMSDVWAAICTAKVVLADCTGRNPNVFYELGLAHVVGKKVILVTQSAEDVPFDIRHLRYIKYVYTPRGMKEFEAVLTATLRVSLNLILGVEGREGDGSS